MGSIGMTEILVIALIAVLLFGAGRIADIGKGLGQGIKNFKEGIKDADDDKESEKAEKPAKADKADKSEKAAKTEKKASKKADDEDEEGEAEKA